LSGFSANFSGQKVELLTIRLLGWTFHILKVLIKLQNKWPNGSCTLAEEDVQNDKDNTNKRKEKLIEKLLAKYLLSQINERRSEG
jgi:hypothetical protein